MSNNQFDLDVQVSKNVGEIQPQFTSAAYCTTGCLTGNGCNSSECATVPCTTTTYGRCF
ncbi:gallidermin/nisin family lantibiotic [Paenibacillus polymyxa]|uniref:gallidermin/nisin family lantibiotic n=1 Tax=Paenibacillus polymyxa TaxID=1406 RepID=UPI00298C026D|nr:gallidermin/nisin family lantibiotic [Paenibacillus polymyxa]